MNLSEHFTLDEMTRSKTALRLGLKNVPGALEVNNLRILCEKVLEDVRAHFGPVHIDSGYRSLQLNAVVGGSETSQHMEGKAADISIPNLSVRVLFDWMVKNCDFDQIILEFPDSEDPWVHVSYSGAANRHQKFVSYKDVNGITAYREAKI